MSSRSASARSLAGEEADTFIIASGPHSGEENEENAKKTDGDLDIEITAQIRNPTIIISEEMRKVEQVENRDPVKTNNRIQAEDFKAEETVTKAKPFDVTDSDCRTEADHDDEKVMSSAENSDIRENNNEESFSPYSKLIAQIENIRKFVSNGATKFECEEAEDDKHSGKENDSKSGVFWADCVIVDE